MQSSKRAVLAGNRALAARHHLVPGAAPRALAVGLQGNNRAAREIGTRLGLLHRGRQRLVEQDARIALGGEFLGVGVDD